ncbi:MAG TPA: TolC family protein [Bryobacteraceae bacterium]|nr:TolC family protein [Bryobacteraceae bacterium]
MKPTKLLSLFIAGLVSQSFGQQMPVVERPQVPVLIRPYKAPRVPSIQLQNSGRLTGLLRAGKLYLTVQDALGLAIENNLDLEVDRYGPLAAQWQLERMSGGGPLKGVTSGNSVVNQVTSGQGVVGSEAAAGLVNTNNGVGNGGAGGVVVSQIGSITPNLDPVLKNTTAFTHSTAPQPNAVVSQTPALVDTQHIYDTVVQQGVITGGYVQVAANETYQRENAPTDVLNPSVVPIVQLYIRHQFLQGFGAAVNSRYIRVAQKNIGLARETFRSQLLNLVAHVLNLYWDLVSADDELKVRQHSLDIAQKFYEDTKKEIELGTVAKFEIYPAEAEVETRRREIAITQASVAQQEISLKNALSRNGLEDPLLDAAAVVPLDRVEVPKQENLPPLRQLVAVAMAKRPDVAMAKINSETAEISALGTINSLLPSLGVIASVTGNGLSGTPRPQANGETPDPYYVGGLGNALGQIFRRDFPSERAAVYIQGPLRNRQDQGDYGVDQLQLRQGELIARRSLNQIVVDVSNYMVALRQARARYSAAVDTRTLDQQLLEKEQQKFSLGASTINDVITAQRSLAAAQIAEVAALSIYSHAQVSLNQVLGETLEKNHVSVDEALAGEVSHQSKAPEAKSR